MTVTSALSQVAYVAGLVVMAPAWGEVLRKSFQESLGLDRELRSIHQELIRISAGSEAGSNEDVLLRSASFSATD